MLSPMTSATLNAGMLHSEQPKAATKEVPMNAALNRLLTAISIAEDVLAELDCRTSMLRMPAVATPEQKREEKHNSQLVSTIDDAAARVETLHKRIRNLTLELEI